MRQDGGGCDSVEGVSDTTGRREGEGTDSLAGRLREGGLAVGL